MPQKTANVTANVIAESRFQSVIEHSETFLNLFPYRWDYLCKPWPSEQNPNPQWATESRHPLHDRLILEGEALYGVRFGQYTEYAMIDIDSGSRYHPDRDPQAIRRMIAALEPIGICRSVSLMSSYSGGIHIYIPFAESRRSWHLANAISGLLRRSGFSLIAGQLEVFPNVKHGKDAKYQGHRLPLQEPGSQILSEDFSPCYTSKEEFCRQWRWAASGNEIASAEKLELLCREFRRRLDYSPVRGSAAKFKSDLEAILAPGWQGPGQSNELLGWIACYCRVFGHFAGISDRPLESEADLAAAIVGFAASLSGFQEFCSHQHDIWQRARDWARAAIAAYYPYGAKQISRPTDPQYNQKKSEDAQARIAQARADLEEKRELPHGITARMKAIAALAKCSYSTLKKYPELWHPDHIPDHPNACPEPNYTPLPEAHFPDRGNACPEPNYTPLPNKVFAGESPSGPQKPQGDFSFNSEKSQNFSLEEKEEKEPGPPEATPTAPTSLEAARNYLGRILNLPPRPSPQPREPKPLMSEQEIAAEKRRQLEKLEEFFRQKSSQIPPDPDPGGKKREGF